MSPTTQTLCPPRSFQGRRRCNLEAGSDRLESSFAMTGRDADDPPFPAERFQRLPKISENDPFLSGLFKKFHREIVTYQSFTTEFGG
jgi:hypothetical protein